MTKKLFDGIVLVSFLTGIAGHALLKSWANKHLAEGHPSGAGNSTAGAIAITL